MTIYDYLEIGNVVTFEVHPSAIIGGRFKTVKVVTRRAMNFARLFGIDPVAMHNNVFPLLPSTVENDPDSYQYVAVKHPNGTVSVLGVPWINENTIQISQRGTLEVIVEDVSVIERERVIQALSSVGITPTKVKLL